MKESNQVKQRFPSQTEPLLVFCVTTCLVKEEHLYHGMDFKCLSLLHGCLSCRAFTDSLIQQHFISVTDVEGQTHFIHYLFM